MIRTSYAHGWRSACSRRMRERAKHYCLPAVAGLIAAVSAAPAAVAGDACGPDFCEPDACLFDGIKNTPLGEARLTLDENCSLRADGLGARGEDGFRQSDFPSDAVHARTRFTGVRFSDNGLGGRIVYSGVPTAAGGEAVVLDVTVENPAGSETLINPDGAPSGAQSYTVRIFADGAPVRQVPALKKGVTRFSSRAALVQVDLRVDVGYVFTYRLDGVVAITIPDDKAVEGDMVQVVANDPQVTVPVVTQVDTTLVNIPTVTVEVEYGGPPIATVCVDQDGDGYGFPGDPSCPRGSETDCDDNNRAVSPGTPESCNGRDDDCDGSVDEDFDRDGDGFTTCNGDCDDGNPLVNPRITEICNGIDDDCDGGVDEGFDRDGDGFTTCGGDCDDGNPAINPEKKELCDGIDNDCNDGVDEDFDLDGDGFTTCNGDCDDGDPAVNPEKKELCDGIDNNCNDLIDEGFDRDGDGFTTCGGDCDDGNPAINPEKEELCDGIDNNCDDRTDEGFDQDGDGFTACGGDCNDGDPSVNPDKVEECNGIDDDCDGITDEGFDRDGDGFTTCGGDCDDGNPGVNPKKEEVCDDIDNDCDESIDEGFDQDGDGYTNCGGDCDDRDPGVNPEKVEICSGGVDEDCDGLIDLRDPDCKGVKEICDGRDNDGDGEVDEDFTFTGVDQDPKSPTYGTVQELPIGATCLSGQGECEAVGTVACSDNGASAVCVAETGKPGAEGPPGDATCFDFRDNDCDGGTDHNDRDCVSEERCDGFDNDADGEIDEDFPALGARCTAGVGVCEKRGVIECNASGSGVVCSAEPGGTPGREGPPGSRFCSDGRDNDCDGAVDPADPDCQEEERCDGRDNDNDGQVDEDFPQLGERCETGEGHCRAEGLFVCSPGGSGVRCDAKPFGARPEGPAGCTCFDEIDNDCDGAVDAEDLNCRSARIGDTIRCALASRRGINDRCSGLHQINFSSTAPDAVVVARLMAIDGDGNVIQSVPVSDGDLGFLQSRSTGPPGSLDPVGTISLGRRAIHWVFAHSPVLEVIADDGLNRGRAYCSILPYLDVVEPDNSVISLSQGDETPVTAAIPKIDPASLQIKVDGVDVISALGLDVSRDFPGGPYAGSFVITHPVLQDRRLVEVCDLVVRSDASGKPSGNTLTMTLRNMGCGGHVIVVEGSPAPRSLPGDPVETCHIDDGRDAGVSNALGVEVLSPQDGAVVLSNAFAVQGVACHGLSFSRLRVAGADQSVAGQTLVPGDGENTADTWVLPLKSRVAVTNLRSELDTGIGIPGQVDPGSNRLVTQVSDVEFNTAFDNVFLAVNPDGGAAGVRSGGVSGGLAPVENAFTVALDGPGMTTFVASLCEEVKPLLEEKVEGALIGRSTNPKSFPVCDAGSNRGQECEDDDDCPGGECKGQPFPLCDLENVILEVTDADLDVSGFECRLVPEQDKISFGITTPAFSAEAHVSGGCADHFLGVCTVSVTLDSDAELSFDNFDVGFEITEAGILNQEFVSEPTFDFGDDPDLVEGSFEAPDIGCIVGFFKFLLEVVFFIIKILSFGLIDISFDEIEFEISSDDLKQKIAERGGDFGEVKEFRFDNERLDDFNLDLSNLLSDVQISPAGIAAGIRASFTAIEEDPEVAETVEVELTPAPLPLPPIAGADEVTVAISDDVFNTLLGGLARGGVLKTLFEDRRELGDLLPAPADCSTLGPVREPRCVGMNGGDCTQFVTQIQRNRCESAKERFESRNLRRNTVIILHGRADNPPKLLIDDDPGTTAVEVHFRYSQISIGIFADRDGDGVLQGEAGAIPPCFGNNQSTTTECALWEACLNLNVPASVEIPPDRLSLVFEVLAFQHDLSTGTLCGGGIEDEDDDLILETAQGDTLDLLNERLREGIPELSSMGLNFGGLVEFQNPRLIAIENDGNGDFQDYIGITGRLVVPGTASQRVVPPVSPSGRSPR